MKKLLFLALALVMVASATQAQQHKCVNVSGKAAVVAQARHRQAPAAKGPKDGTTIAQFPYSEGFENGLGDWTALDADNDGYTWDANEFSNEGLAHTGNGVVASASYINGIGVLTPDNWLVSPAFQLPASGSFQLSWWVAALDGDYPAEQYQVMLSTTDSAISSFTTQLYSDTLSSDQWGRVTIDLSSYAGQRVFIAFRHHGSSDEYWMLLDDISIAVAGAPEAALVGPSYAFTGDTVQFSAELISGSNVTFDWAFQGGTPATVQGSTANVVWTNGGDYTVTLTAANAIDTLVLTHTISIIDCGTITEFPFTEGFENGLGCWAPLDADGDGYTWYPDNLMPHSGRYSVTSESWGGDNSEALTPDNYLVSPAIAVPANGIYELQWYITNSSSEYPEEHYSVAVSTTGTNPADFSTVLYTKTLTAADAGYIKHVVSLEQLAGQTIRIAFRHHACTDMYAIYLDDITICEATAPDVTISGPATVRNIGSYTYTAAVESSTPITSYEWHIAGANPATGSDQSITTSWEGASAGTYKVTAIATNAFGADTASLLVNVLDCASNITTFPYTESFDQGIGCWNTIDADGDGHCWMAVEEFLGDLTGEAGYGSQLGHSGTDVLVSWSYFPLSYSIFGIQGESVSADDILVSPAIELPAQPMKLEFFVLSFDNEYPDDIEVRLATGTTEPASAADFTVQLMPRTTVGADDYRQCIIDLSAYAGQTIYLGFEHQTTDMFGILLDDVSIASDFVGIADVLRSTVTLSPNPATDYVDVNAEGLQRVEVIDLNGRTMLTAEQSRISLSSLPQGIYMLRVTTAQGVTMQKLVRQ